MLECCVTFPTYSAQQHAHNRHSSAPVSFVRPVTPAKSGIMLDNFNGGTSGNFSGMVVTQNNVQCSSRCHYGIEVGPHPVTLS